MPLAVVGSNVVIEVNGKKVRGRQYPWGVAEGRFTRVRRLTGWTRIPSCGLTASRERVGDTVCELVRHYGYGLTVLKKDIWSRV